MEVGHHLVPSLVRHPCWAGVMVAVAGVYVRLVPRRPAQAAEAAAGAAKEEWAGQLSSLGCMCWLEVEAEEGLAVAEAEPS